MTNFNRLHKLAAYRYPITLRGFAATLGESAGLSPAFVGRLSGIPWGSCRMGKLRLSGGMCQDEAATELIGNDDDKTQANWHNAALALTGLVGGFNALLGNLSYLVGDENPAARINRCWSQVLRGGTCP